MLDTSLPRLLVLEDERSHQLIIMKCLEGFYQVRVAGSIQEALAAIDVDSNIDLFLLDVMLPDGTGFDFLNEVRRREGHRLTPVIFLTVKDDTRSKLTGFSLGADDYVIKPAEPLELRARIDAKLRKMKEMRETSGAPLNGLIRLPGMTLDPGRQAVWLEMGETRQALELTSLEFRLLHFFVRHASQGLTRKKILSEVWGDNTHVLERSVDSYVATLRKKLGPVGEVIKSVHGVGYKFVPLTKSGRKVS
jgi:DNA-binding response OmpR family regulator